jgi:CRISPR/Cas system CMR subunit Cmr4 (Cas7 group RAMP superfamily)
MIDTLLQFKDLMTGSKDSKISKEKEKLKEQIKNYGKKKKKKNEDDNNMEDLPRGLKMDTTTNSSGTTREFSMGGDVTVGKGSDYIKDLID